MSKKLVACVLVGSLALVSAAACGSSSRVAEDAGDGGGTTTGAPGSSGDLSSGGASGSIGSSGGGPGDSGLAECAAETQKADALPLDILIMLDASGSMMGQASGATKWVAVKAALNGFVGAPTSSGIGVGLGIFPIKHPGAPAQCTSNANCIVNGESFGRCFLKACQLASANDRPQSCDTSADCPGGVACRNLGVCRQGAFTFGDCIVGDPIAGGCAVGKCEPATVSGCDGTQCFLSDYSTPTVPIAALPANANALTGAINGLPDPPNDALTPTSAAITGGLAITRAHATANPGHAVVMVLATDGLPTLCAPLDIPSIANITAAGVTGTPSIKTFVIGVFSTGEASVAKPNLDALATAGGTGSAFIVNTSSNVTQQFQAALESIRGAALPCEYNVPKPAEGTPDYDKLNVELTAGGNKTVIGNRKSAQGCDASGGWYYDVDPATGATPAKIVLCPTTCDAVKQGPGAAQVDIVLGCKTVVK